MYNHSLESWTPALQDAILTLYKFSFHYLEKFKSPTMSIVEKIINLKIMIFDIITMIFEFYEELKMKPVIQVFNWYQDQVIEFYLCQDMTQNVKQSDVKF